MAPTFQGCLAFVQEHRLISWKYLSEWSSSYLNQAIKHVVQQGVCISNSRQVGRFTQFYFELSILLRERWNVSILRHIICVVSR